MDFPLLGPEGSARIFSCSQSGPSTTPRLETFSYRKGRSGSACRFAERSAKHQTGPWGDGRLRAFFVSGAELRCPVTT